MSIGYQVAGNYHRSRSVYRETGVRGNEWTEKDRGVAFHRRCYFKIYIWRWGQSLVCVCLLVERFLEHVHFLPTWRQMERAKPGARGGEGRGSSLYEWHEFPCSCVGVCEQVCERSAALMFSPDVYCNRHTSISNNFQNVRVSVCVCACANSIRKHERWEWAVALECTLHSGKLLRNGPHLNICNKYIHAVKCVPALTEKLHDTFFFFLTKKILSLRSWVEAEKNVQIPVKTILAHDISKYTLINSSTQ